MTHCGRCKNREFHRYFAAAGFCLFSIQRTETLKSKIDWNKINVCFYYFFILKFTMRFSWNLHHHPPHTWRKDMFDVRRNCNISNDYSSSVRCCYSLFIPLNRSFFIQNIELRKNYPAQVIFVAVDFFWI